MSEAQAELDKLYGELESETQQVKKVKDLLAQATRIQDEVEADARAHRHLLAKLIKNESVVHALEGTSGASMALRDRVKAMQRMTENTLSIAPSTGSLFVRLFLGRVNVRILREADRTQLRDEYNKFKSRTNVMFCLLPIFNMLVFYKLNHFWRYTHWCNILSHVWLLYYYVSLALRENILRVNGSNIRKWWIQHHYLSAFVSIVFLTWPETKLYRTFMPQFNLYCLCQGIVQFMQAAYQKKRLYIRKAIGQAGPMDVSQTETITESPKDLYLLLVFIFAVQVFQVYNGVALGMYLFTGFDADMHWYNYREEVQAVIVSLLFTVLGIVNFLQTILVVVDKRRRNTRQRRSRSSTPKSPRKALPVKKAE